MEGPAAKDLLSRRRIDAVLFDMDGVVTDTARAHAAAWKRLFDEFLGRLADERGKAFVPFDPKGDYRAYVDGRPRADGVRAFLEARGIFLPEGDPDEPSEGDTIAGLAARKNDYFHEWLEQHRVHAFEGTLDLIRALKAESIRVAVFSASRNAASVLENAGVHALFDARVDGADLARLALPGKPDPSMLLEAAGRLDVEPARAAVIEDATAGIEAGRRGGFALVVGVDRSGDGAALRAAGADLVVRDPGELLRLSGRAKGRPPSVGDQLDELRARLAGHRLAIFLDYDGTLMPIVDDPDQALMSEEMRAAVARLARRFPVAIVSGRSLGDVRRRVALDNVIYAGSHGFEIEGLDGTHEILERGREALPALDAAERALNAALAGIEGHVVERKPFSIAIHYRRVAQDHVPEIERAVDGVIAAHPGLRKGAGKKVFQVQPDINWDKGCAVLWLLERLGSVLPIYIGDDVTDEDAFRALEAHGIGIVVQSGGQGTKAAYALADPRDVRRFLDMLASPDGLKAA
jgi:alpha,alpha-trehalase